MKDPTLVIITLILLCITTLISSLVIGDLKNRVAALEEKASHVGVPSPDRR